ncbi:hypothetical protein HDU78_006406 [Chytriomyces hyalinus]|nr:hypothetical protein HDU78_006406 [Chytriomyces hyalinus]
MTESLMRKLSLAQPQQQPSTPVEEVSFSMRPEAYELGNPIAMVYIAKYIPMNKIVATKVIDLDMFERNQIDELRREIQIMSLSRHPNLLPVYGSFVNGPKLFIVTPFLSAGSLLDIMKTAYPTGIEESCIATILKQALQGLEYLHRNGLIHRDVKAGNLLMDEDGLVQLADFGVSSSLMETGERKGNRKTFVGTPCWMAPEVMEQSGYDYKADIWSFGITALELATGHAPFAKYPPMKVMMMTLQNDPPTLDRDQTRHKFTKCFKDLIDACLQKDPNKRPTAEKLLQHAFFRQYTKKRSHLATDLLQALPPITKRAHIKRTVPRFTEDAKGVSWDFSSVSSDEPQDVFECEDESNAFPTEAGASIDPYQPGSSHGHIPMYNPSPLSASNAFESDKPAQSDQYAVVPPLNSSAPCAEVKKGRFSVTGQQPQSQPSLGVEGSSQPGTSPAMSQDESKQRFGVTSDSSSSSSPILSEASPRQSRFTVTANESASTAVPMTLNVSNDKRSRFAVQPMQAPVLISDMQASPASSPTVSGFASRFNSTATAVPNSIESNFTPLASESVVSNPSPPASVSGQQLASHEAVVLNERLDTIQRQNVEQQRLLADLLAMMAKNGMNSPVPGGLPVVGASPSVQDVAASHGQSNIEAVAQENRALREENEALTGRQADLERQLRAALSQIEALKKA